MFVIEIVLISANSSQIAEFRTFPQGIDMEPNPLPRGLFPDHFVVLIEVRHAQRKLLRHTTSAKGILPFSFRRSLGEIAAGLRSFDYHGNRRRSDCCSESDRGVDMPIYVDRTASQPRRCARNRYCRRFELRVLANAFGLYRLPALRTPGYCIPRIAFAWLVVGSLLTAIVSLLGVNEAVGYGLLTAFELVAIALLCIARLMLVNAIGSSFIQGGVVHSRLSEFVKRAMDLLISLSLLCVSAPILVILITLLSLDGGPAFYSQKQVGLGGQIFRCWKFRTMVVDAEEKLKELLARDAETRREYEKFWKLKNDPRVTTVGGFLRRYSLDELPQIFNVINGDMSLVGPRPRSVEEIAFFESKMPEFNREYRTGQARADWIVASQRAEQSLPRDQRPARRSLYETLVHLGRHRHYPVDICGRNQRRGGSLNELPKHSWRSALTILRQPGFEFKLGFLRVEMAG